MQHAYSGDGSTAELRGSEAVAGVHAARLDAVAAAARLWLVANAKEVRKLLLVNVELVVKVVIATLRQPHTHTGWSDVMRLAVGTGGHPAHGACM